MGVFDESVRTFLQPVWAYLEDDQITEVLVNGPHEVFVERNGILEPTDVRFKDEQALQAAVRNIAQYVGRTIDSENPILDARLPDGSRIAAVFPPCSRKGTTLSIRKFQTSMMTLLDMINSGCISKEAARFLDVCIFLAKNIMLSGGTGSGKTTFLGVLGSRIPEKQRLIIIEDSTELKIQSKHAVFFETKLPRDEDSKEVTIRDLLKSSLRLRPDRIIVGEVRGPEALDLITAMNTGHGGSMGTLHANSPKDALIRLETLAMMGETHVPVSAIRRQIAGAIHILVHIKRIADGSRRITSITEVLPDIDRDGQYQTKDIYQFIQRGKSATGKIIGEIIPTGYIPSFMPEIELNRIPFARDRFTPPAWYQPAANGLKVVA